MDTKVEASGLDDKVTAVVTEVMAHRAVIEQAKGMLMFIYGVDADGAFAILREQSQRHNVKLRLVAEQISKELLKSVVSQPRPAADLLLATARQRVNDAAIRRIDAVHLNR